MLPVILLLCSLHFTHSADNFPNGNPFHQMPAFKTPVSPLDAPRSIVEKKPVPNSRDLFSDLSSLTPCQKGCSNTLMDSLGLIMKSMPHTQRYELVCKSYNESYACIEQEKKCGNEDHTLFETFTSGVRYMCVEQQLAFNNTIQCIDAQSSQVQAECDGECNTKTAIMNMVMRSSIAKQIQSQFLSGFPTETEAATVPQLDPNTFNELNSMSSELCQIGDCVLRCIKNKFNARCEGSAGALLTEVFVRPIAETQNQLATISPILGMFLPQSCTYLHSGADLARHRMDPSLDSDLRRMYAEKEAEKRINQTAEIVQQPAIPMPKITSPLDGPTSINAAPKLRIPNPPAPAPQPIKPTPLPRFSSPPVDASVPASSHASAASSHSAHAPVKPTPAPISRLNTPTAPAFATAPPPKAFKPPTFNASSSVAAEPRAPVPLPVQPIAPAPLPRVPQVAVPNQSSLSLPNFPQIVFNPPVIASPNGPATGPPVQAAPLLRTNS